MQINLILAALAEWVPIAVIVFVVALIIFALRWPPANQRRERVGRFDRSLRARQARSPIRLWVEIVIIAVATSLLVTLIDWLLRR